ncbi:MAG: DUF5317 domain-containing protein [Chloroflexota bacterium]
MLLLAFVLLGIAVGLLRGGNLRHLADLPLRWAWLIFLGFLLQFAAFTELGPALLARLDLGTVAPRGLLSAYATPALHLASYAAILLFILLNLGFWPLRILGLGTLANVAAIAANGGYMPASPAAMQAAGLEQQMLLLAEKGHLANSTLANEATQLAFLGDIFGLPAGTLANVFSVGDVLIGLGALLLVAAGMRPKRVEATGDYTSALALIQAWPAPPPGCRPSGYRSRRHSAV